MKSFRFYLQDSTVSHETRNEKDNIIHANKKKAGNLINWFGLIASFSRNSVN